MRIQKIIADHGLMSRRKAEQVITKGLVCVNGVPAKLGDVADEDLDEITIDGVRLPARQRARYIMLNKPRGYLTAMSDQTGRKTVAQLVLDCPERIFPVGRLDQASEGLLLLTNDGDLANRLMHPSHLTNKTYLVWVNAYTTERERALSAPIVLDGRKIAPPKVRCLWHRGEQAQFQITIHEGRNRQIRRMCEVAGMRTTRLKRISEAGLRLGDLAPGAWRDLTPEEVFRLKKE